MTNPVDMSLEDTLSHYGVRGMKWGVRNGVGRPTAGAIQKARQNVASQKRGVVAAKRSARSAVRPETKLKRKLDYLDKKAAFLNNPDRATAQRITKGDLIVTGILAAGNPFSAAANAGAIGVGVTKRVATRKVIERRQATGSYTRVASNRKANARNASR